LFFILVFLFLFAWFSGAGPPPHAPAMEPPPEAADVDFSEVFAGDKIAFNNSKLNYWRTPRR